MSAAYPSPGNYTQPIESVIKSLDTDNMKQFLTKFSRYVGYVAWVIR